MALNKPRGKHAQGAHAIPVVIKPEETEGQEPEGAGTVEEKLEGVSKPETVAEPETAAEPEKAPAATGETPLSDEPSPEPLPTPTPAPQTGATPDMPAYPPYPPADAYASILPDGVVLHKKRRVGKVVGITFGIIIGILLVAYIIGAVVFMGRFFPNTTIAGHDISLMPNEEVAKMLDDTVSDYSLDVVGNGFSYKTDASKLGLSIDSEGVVNAIHAELTPWAWPVLLFQNEHDETSHITVTYKTQNFENELKTAIETYNKDAVAPVDATIAYDEATKKFKIINEVPGTQYDVQTVLTAMEDAVEALEPRVKLTSEHLVQPKVLSTDERLVSSAELATGLVSAHVTLTLAGKPATVIDGNSLSQFVHLDESMGVTLDEAALDQWVTDLSNGFDTVGTERTYTRPDGKVITINGGEYGWATDAYELRDQVVAAIKAGETTTIDIPCQQTAAVYNGPGQPDWGNRYIDVDLSEQYVRFYGDDGAIIWEAACISGTPDGKHNTWPGVWYITNKESPSKLIGYTDSGQKEYETTVQFWMAFEGNGIGLHDATWQPSFGGSMYMSGYGSHGCVNLSYGDAESLYGICNVGDVVIAHY